MSLIQQLLEYSFERGAGRDDPEPTSDPLKWKTFFLNSTGMLSSSIQLVPSEDSHAGQYSCQTSLRGTEQLSIQWKNQVIAKSHHSFNQLVIEYLDPSSGVFSSIQAQREGRLRPSISFKYNDIEYILEQLKDPPLTSETSSFLSRFRKHYQIKEKHSGKIVAMLISMNSGKKKGVLRLRKNLSGNLEIIFLTAIMATRAIQRQRAATAGSGVVV